MFGSSLTGARRSKRGRGGIQLIKKLIG